MRECPVLYPTLDDIQKPFEAFIEKHEKKIAQAGIAKIVGPEGWSPRRQGYPDDLDFTIERPIRQHATGSRGLYRGLYIEEKPLSLRRGFRPQALAHENLPPHAIDLRDLERKFWKNVTLRPPLYGADVLGSLFDEDCQGWNLRRLDTVLSRVLHEAGHSLPGVSEPYLYFGMWRSTFAWHTEDLDLYSVNYLHFGAPKQWYCIPPDSRKRFEGLIKGMLPDLFKACPEFFRHKELIISPQLLDTFAIPYIKTVQYAREFVINYPGAYHAGYNCGYNCAESVNFGTRRWVPLGAAAGVCKCNPDSVTIDMRLFRNLVPSRLLPPAIFEDTSSEEEDEDRVEEDEGEGDVSADGFACRRESSLGVGHVAFTTGVGRGVAGAMTGLPGEGHAAPASQPRRRGRPPKRPLPVNVATAAIVTAADVKRQCIAQEGVCDSTNATSMTSPPRRRGRPPKAATVAAAAAAAATAEGQQSLLTFEDSIKSSTPAPRNAILHSGLPCPKRRGRPPKRRTIIGGGATAAAAAGCMAGGAVVATAPATSMTGAAGPTKPRRPRGRPRKHPFPLQPAEALVPASPAAATIVPGLVVITPLQSSALAGASVMRTGYQRVPVDTKANGKSAIAGGGNDAAFAVQHPGFEETSRSSSATAAAVGCLQIKRLRDRPLKVPELEPICTASTPFLREGNDGDDGGGSRVKEAVMYITSAADVPAYVSTGSLSTPAAKRPSGRSRKAALRETRPNKDGDADAPPPGCSCGSVSACCTLPDVLVAATPSAAAAAFAATAKASATRELDCRQKDDATRQAPTASEETGAMSVSDAGARAAMIPSSTAAAAKTPSAALRRQSYLELLTEDDPLARENEEWPAMTTSAGSKLWEGTHDSQCTSVDGGVASCHDEGVAAVHSGGGPVASTNDITAVEATGGTAQGTSAALGNATAEAVALAEVRPMGRLCGILGSLAPVLRLRLLRNLTSPAVHHPVMTASSAGIAGATTAIDSYFNI